MAHARDERDVRRKTIFQAKHALLEELVARDRDRERQRHAADRLQMRRRAACEPMRTVSALRGSCDESGRDDAVKHIEPVAVLAEETHHAALKKTTEPRGARRGDGRDEQRPEGHAMSVPRTGRTTSRSAPCVIACHVEASAIEHGETPKQRASRKRATVSRPTLAHSDRDETAHEERVEATRRERRDRDIAGARRRENTTQPSASTEPATQIRRSARPRERENDERPEQIEVLLDGERPKVAHVGKRPVAVNGDVEVRAVRPEPALMTRGLREPARVRDRERRQNDEEERERAVIERENAERSTHVEVSEVARRVFRVVEDSGDQETGEDEEEIDSPDTVVRELHGGAFSERVRRGVADEVDEDAP